MYPNNDPISFICAFYGCIMAGVVPVPVEVPLNKRGSGSNVSHSAMLATMRSSFGIGLDIFNMFSVKNVIQLHYDIKSTV